MKHIIMVLVAGAASGLVSSALLADGGPTAPGAHLTLAPAAIAAKSQPGQSWTRTFQMTNFTAATLRFTIEVQDAVAKDGERTLVPAGEAEGGIAMPAAVSPREIEIAPHAVGSVTVTVTVPERTSPPGVVVYLRGAIGTLAEHGTVGIGASLGTLVSFQLPGDQKAAGLDFSGAPQTDTINLTISQELQDTGQEPVVPSGAGALLDDAGRRVSKVIFAGI